MQNNLHDAKKLVTKINGNGKLVSLSLLVKTVRLFAKMVFKLLYKPVAITTIIEVQRLIKIIIKLIIRTMGITLFYNFKPGRNIRSYNE